MSSKTSKRGSQSPSEGWFHSQVRPAVRKGERRESVRWASDAQVEILTPVPTHASALDVSASGIQLALDEWISTGTTCDLRITTHTGRVIFKRARVVWTRRVRNGCVAGLKVVGSIRPSAPPAE
jgi:hypothetical protein